MSRLSLTVSALALIGALASNPAEAAQRAFVASSGSDGNTATGCGLAAPCRTFAMAMTVVSDGGEIVALDAAGYGPVTITKSVTITANPGFYAGIAVASGDGVTIATAAVNVILRGLIINGTGGTNGVVMTNGNTLSIENCVISNFPGGSGVEVDVAAKVRVVDSLIRGNNNGVHLQGGAYGDVAASRILGNIFIAITAEGAVASTTTTVVVTDTIVAGNGFGIIARSLGSATGNTSVSVIRSTVSNSATSAVVAVSGAGASAVLTLSESLVASNQFGLVQSGAGAVLESLGNNTVRQNATTTSGTVTTVSTM
jgi:hypothetical protein